MKHLNAFNTIKTISLILLASILAGPIFAQSNTNATMQTQDSVVHKTSFFFTKDQSWWFDKMDSYEIMTLVLWVKDNGKAKIKIEGWTDNTGGESQNANISDNRALTAQGYLVNEGISASRISYKGMGADKTTDSNSARRADIIAYLEVESPTSSTSYQTTETKAETLPQQAYDPSSEITYQAQETQIEPTEEKVPQQSIDPSAKSANTNTTTVTASVESAQASSTIEEESSAQESTVEQTQDITSDYSQSKTLDLSLRTNLLYWATGMFNIGAEWKPNNTQLGVILNLGYSPFASSRWENALGGWFIAPEARYYIPGYEQWFAGVQFLAGGYNIKLSDTGRQGSVLGGGIVGGYKMKFTNCLDIDFSLGLGYGSFNYDSYYRSNGTNVYKEKNVRKSSIMPIQAGVNLIWKIK